MVPQRIEREILIDAPVELVWAVVTEPEHISGWFSDVAELDLRPGGSMVLRWSGHGTVHGQVERVEHRREQAHLVLRDLAQELRREALLGEEPLDPGAAVVAGRVVGGAGEPVAEVEAAKALPPSEPPAPTAETQRAAVEPVVTAATDTVVHGSVPADTTPKA